MWCFEYAMHVSTKKINGFMVSFNAPKPYNFVYPQYLEKDIKNKFDYKFIPDYIFESDKNRTIPSIKKIIKLRFDVASYLLNKFKPVFFHMTIFYVDHMQHFYWKFMETKDIIYGDAITDCWIFLDNQLDLFIKKHADRNTYIFLMSDHGFTSVKGVFQLGRWLINKNYLFPKKTNLSLIRLFSKFGLRRDNVIKISSKIKLFDLLNYKYFPSQLAFDVGKKFFPNEDVGRESEELENLINWEKSKIIPLSDGLLYINKKLFKSRVEYELFKEIVINELNEIKNPINGERLANKIYKKEELYNGTYINNAPDIILLPTEGYEVVSSFRRDELWNFSPDKWTGTHKLHGIFIACGPKIKKDAKVNNIKIYDIAPTILHLFGLPIPKDMDGKVLKNLFKEDSVFMQKPIVYQEEEYEKKKLK